jgi:hypothetical protein
MQLHSYSIIGSLVTLVVAGLFGPTESAYSQNQPRPFATGVLQTIPITLNPRDTHSLPIRLTGVEAKAWKPATLPTDKTLEGKVQQVTLYRDPVWEYEFSFLPLRQETVGIPDQFGELNDVNVWYLVFRVRNTGASMSYKDVKQSENSDHVVKKLQMNQPVDPAKVQFLPRFVLEGWVEGANNKYKKVAYPSVIDASALAQIQNIEDPNQKLLDPHQISNMKIPLAKTDADPGVWGVAIWKNVEPRIDYVSVKVNGLSNARRMTDPKTRSSIQKTLQLNFWRPGDAVGQRRDAVNYGIPLVDDPQEQIRITRFYNLPGPQIRLYEVNETAKRELLMGEISGGVDLKTFKSGLTDELDGGKLPAMLLKSVAKTGLKIDAGADVKTVIPGSKWTFTAGEKRYVVKLEPQYWEPDFGKIRFIKTLDYLWIYR